MKRFVFTCTVLLLLGLWLAAPAAQAQDDDTKQELIILRSDNVVLPSLLDAAAFERQNPPPVLFNDIPNFHFKEDVREQIGGGGNGPDPLLGRFNPSAPTTILTQFDGADNTDNPGNVTPPDTDGDVSSDAVDRYMQMINIVTEVFDKSGTSLGGGAFPSSAFWAGFGGLCETNDNGDPIVLYDETNDRWLVSQFAFASTSTPPWLQCIAVSQTSDPLGAYNRYAYDFASFGFNDYPKFGFTTNAITMMANLFNPFFVGTFLGVADKNCMYAGNPSCVLVGANLGSNEFGFVAGDLDDAAGMAGFVPALFATAMTANGLFDIWEIDPNFANPPATTITRIERVPIATFDSDLCTATRERCVPHSGPGANLETLSGRLMHRLAIKDFGTHLSMVAAHTVDVDGAPPGVTGRTGIRWYELRSTDGGASWSLHQEGTHGPADNLWRWMPSIAINDAGDIGIGFMVSDDLLAPAIYVTGQTAAQSGSGVFDADEAVCRAGQAGSDWAGRAGDYSATNVDPDRDTFWHTNEFGRVSTSRGWGTAVCEFELVTTGNQPPTVTITAPPNGSSFTQGTSVNFTGTATDPEDGNISANINWSSDLDGGLGTGASISATLSVGVHTITASVTDLGGLSDSDQITVTIIPVGGGTNQLETVVVNNVGTAWTTVPTGNTYTDMVAVCTPNYANNTIPLVVRMRNAGSSSFEIRLQNPSNSGLSAEDVYCLVVEAGQWQLPDGRAIEAQKYLSTVTDENNAWVGEAQSYLNTYANPVVLGQVMTANDADWSVFWNQGTSRTNPPVAGALITGKTVAEDTNTNRANEDVGFVVIEAGTGSVGGSLYEAALGADIVAGVDNSPPYNYTFTQSFGGTPDFAVATQAAMDGNNGGWAYLFGASPLSATTMGLVIDEDQIGDNERAHTTEQVGYLVFGQNVDLPLTPPNQPPTVTITNPPSGSTFNQGDNISFTGTAIDPEDGNISANLTWTSSIDGSIGSGASFMTSSLSVGTHTITASVTDLGGLSDDDQISVTINAVGGGNALETVFVSGVGTGWTTVNLGNTYTSMVAVCTREYANNTLPGVVRMRNAAGSSFEIRLQNPSDTAINAEDVYCIAMEEGAGQLSDGRNIEAQKYTSTVTDENNAWVGQQQSYTNSYASPVVLGQVMTANDPDWSVFWSRGTSRTNPPSASTVYTGKHVGEDIDNTRANETVGFIVIEAGTGSLSGNLYEAALGADIVRGIDNNPPFNYTFGQSFSGAPDFAVASQAAMDGGHGSWVNFFGGTPLSATTMSLTVDEDQINDAERAHTTEQVAYLAFQTNINTTYSALQLAVEASEGIQALGFETQAEVPEAFAVTAVYPNPFSQQVTIQYGLPETAYVRMAVYNMLGQRVQTLVDGTKSEGFQTVAWDGRAADGGTLSSGVYLIRFEAGDSNQSRTVIFVR